MNKIYLGETEVANVGSGGGGGVTDASFNELARVTASALLDLKGLEDNVVEDVDKIEGHVETIDSQIQTLDANKADSSVVYTKSDVDKADKVTAAALASLDGRVSELEEGGGGGGITPQQLDASLKAYTYDKAYLDASVQALDASIVALDASALAFDASIKELAEGGGGGGGITPQQLDASLKAYTYDKTFIDASIHQIDVSINALEQGGGGGFDPTNINASINDISTRVRTIENDYVVDDDISTFKPIVYTTKDDYEEDVSEGTIDPDTMYVITDLASSDELSNIVTIDDLNAEKARINASLNESGDEVITAANSSMNYWKTTNVSQCQSQCTTAKNSAVSAVQSQQTTSVNAVNTAKNTAISEIDTKMAQMKTFEVMTEAEYAEITPDENTIYFITD